jgi:hypothetical protein
VERYRYRVDGVRPGSRRRRGGKTIAGPAVLRLKARDVVVIETRRGTRYEHSR